MLFFLAGWLITDVISNLMQPIKSLLLMHPSHSNEVYLIVIKSNKNQHWNSYNTIILLRGWQKCQDLRLNSYRGLHRLYLLCFTVRTAEKHSADVSFVKLEVNVVWKLSKLLVAWANSYMRNYKGNSAFTIVVSKTNWQM